MPPRKRNKTIERWDREDNYLYNRLSKAAKRVISDETLTSMQKLAWFKKHKKDLAVLDEMVTVSQKRLRDHQELLLKWMRDHPPEERRKKAREASKRRRDKLNQREQE